MSWLISILAALLAGVAGLFLAGVIANACVSWYHVSSREGAAGYFVVFTALAGGVAGTIIGLITARLIATHFGAGFAKELCGALGLVLVSAGVAALLCRLLADVPPKIDGREPDLEVEFRFPATPNSSEPPTPTGEWTVQLDSISGHTQRTYRTGTVHTNAARFEAGHWIVPSEVFLFTARGKRAIALYHQDQHIGGMLLPLPARPGESFEQWSEWLPRQQADGQSWPADRMSYRFRVKRETPPPPPKTQAEYQAEEAAKKEAEFAALPSDAPLQLWLPYLDYDQPQTERALQHVANRPNLAAELGQLAAGDDAELAGKALRCIDKLPTPTRELIPPVEAAGRDIAARLRQVNATTVEQDPGYHGAASISIRFSAWMCAARKLRAECGGDFSAELKPILELSRVRPDSYVLRMDVCRVASYYLHQWAGVEPLPTDPKPR
jgi:hypothetical protein